VAYTLAATVTRYCESLMHVSCELVNLKLIRVPISNVEKAGQGQAFEHMHCDVFERILPGQNVRFNYADIVNDSISRYPFVYLLRPNRKS